METKEKQMTENEQELIPYSRLERVRRYIRITMSVGESENPVGCYEDK